MTAEYTPTTKRVRDLFTWAYAWRTADYPEDGDVDLSVLRARNRAEFDRWLAGHDREVSAKAVEDAADFMASLYPESVFRPMVDADHREVNDALAGRIERTNVSRDRVSADMMRRAAEQQRTYAAEIREGGRE